MLVSRISKAADRELGLYQEQACCMVEPILHKSNGKAAKREVENEIGETPPL
jgi:hypothetical protein